MKKNLAVLLFIIFAVTLTACSNTKTTIDASQTSTTDIQTNDATELNTTDDSVSSVEPGSSEYIHSFLSATCTEPARCSCGTTEGETLGHDYSNATCTEAMKCIRCGTTDGSTLGHSYDNATCTNAKKCTRCGITNGSALGHSYDNATCTEAKRCANCGETSGEALGHNYSNGVCVRCEKKLISESHGYSVGDVVTGTNEKGDPYTLKYLSDDRWEDQYGHIWTAYENEEGSIRWNTFYFG